MNASGFAVVGTPDDAIAQIRRLEEQSGGFGTFLVMAHEWADREATLRSYELLAREVMPAFQGRPRHSRTPATGPPPTVPSSSPPPAAPS
jgi:limonene 1,2-monooxygenase